MKKINNAMFAFGFILLMVGGCQISPSEKVDKQKFLSTDVSLEQSGVMKSAEYNRIKAIDESVQSGASMSEADASWLLSIADKRDEKKYVYGLRLIHASMPFRHSKPNQWPPAVTDRVFKLGTEMVSFDYQSVINPQTSKPLSHVVAYGCMLLGNTEDQRALPLLAKHINSSDSGIAQMAKFATNKLNSGKR